MSRPRTLSDAELHRVAREAFCELGPSAPVSAVARRLGVTQAALFHRSGSKEALMLKALSPGAPEALAAFAQPPRKDRSLHDQLAPTLQSLLGFLRDAIPGLMVLRGAGVSFAKAMPGPPPPVAMRAALASFLSVADARGLTTLEDPAATADAMLGALEARVMNAYLGGPTFVEADDHAFLKRLLAVTLP
jgi:AcrR family transcriptional regulator